MTVPTSNNKRRGTTDNLPPKNRTRTQPEIPNLNVPAARPNYM